MVIILTKKSTNRLRYALDIIFNNLLGVDYTLTEDEEEFLNSEAAKIHYGKERIQDEFFIHAHTLLFERGLNEQKPDVYDWQGTKAFFRVSEKSDFPFDIFAATFYLLSRYEENLPHIKDKFGRFPAEESLAFQEGFLDEPVVNHWSVAFGKVLKEKFQGLSFEKKEYRFTPTYDIDSIYSYLHKGLIRTIGGFLVDLKNLELADLKKRSRVILRLEKDPFNTFEHIKRVNLKFGHYPIFFFLVGDYDEYDKNISVKTPEVQSMIKSIADYFQVGLHPSYASNSDFNKLEMERNRLSEVLKRDVYQSRQHFLKVNIPSTYQDLFDLDITEEYSMGYAAHNGFRASIADPFYFYDLDLEIKTPLKVFPFQIMDATYQYYMNISPEEALEEAKKMVDKVKSVDGHLITLWHNNSLSEEKEWVGWREVHDKLLEYAAG